MDILQDKIRQQAVDLGLCDQYQEEWKSPLNIAQLCRLFHRGQDFCIKHNYPSIEDIRQFGEEPKRYGVYATDGISTDQSSVVVVGDADVTIVVHGVSDITARHNSTVRIRLAGDAFCYVSAYDNCRVIVEQKDEKSRLCMSYWSGEICDKEKFDKINYKNQ